jgi:outer membrane protein W
MLTRLVAAVFLAASLLLPLTASADTGEAGTNIQLLGGFKTLTDSDWKPAEDQTVFGVQYDVQPESWPLSFAVGLITGQSPSEESDVATLGKVTSQSRTTELNVGVRKYIQKDKLRPFVGVGISVVRAELETTTAAGSVDDSGTGAGPWAGLGILYMISDWLGVGAQVQYSYVKVDDIFDQNLDAGGVQIDGLFNFHF